MLELNSINDLSKEQALKLLSPEKVKQIQEVGVDNGHYSELKNDQSSITAQHRKHADGLIGPNTRAVMRRMVNVGYSLTGHVT